MLLAGMNVARLNMSHGDDASHHRRLDLLREASSQTGLTVAVMVDTKGREIRTGTLGSTSILLERHQPLSLFCDGQDGDRDGISVSHGQLYRHVSPGHRILLDDGQIELIVEKVRNQRIDTVVECGGVLRDHKGVSLPDSDSAFDDLSSDDSREIDFSAQRNVEYLAASFIRNANDVVTLRNALRSRGANIPIIAKIENREGVKNLNSIISAANGIMVARGDLGVALELGEGPTIQKQIIRATVSQGKPVITATQMLDSMERNPRPTRAEVSDVANAIFDGTSAVMLSGETAVGRRPVEAVETMDLLARAAESSLGRFGYLQQIESSPSNEVTEAVAQASITMANHLNAAAIIALTETGMTARMISKYRPDCPILAVTSSPTVVSRLAMNWGVLALLYEGTGTDDERIVFATGKAREMGFARDNTVMIMTAGSSRLAGSTDLIRVLRIT